MLQGHAPGAKLLRVYQRFHGYTSSSGASSQGKLSELENAPSCVLTRAKWAWSMLREQNPSCVSAFRVNDGKCDHVNKTPQAVHSHDEIWKFCWIKLWPLLRGKFPSRLKWLRHAKETTTALREDSCKFFSPARARAAAITCGVSLSMKSPVTRTCLTLLVCREFSTALLACVRTRATLALSSSACISKLLCCCILSPSSALLTASAAPARRSTGADASAVRSSTRAVSRWTWNLKNYRISCPLWTSTCSKGLIAQHTSFSIRW